MTTLDTEHAAVELAEQMEAQKPVEQVFEAQSEDAMAQVVASQPKTKKALEHAAELMSFWAEDAPAKDESKPEDNVEFADSQVDNGFLGDFAADSAMVVGDLAVGDGGGSGDMGGGGGDGGPSQGATSGGSGQN